MLTFGDAYSFDLSQFYISCRITGVPPLQSDFSGLIDIYIRGSLENRPKRKVGVPPNSLSSVSEIRGPRVPLFLTLDSFFLEMRKDKVCSENRRTRALTRLSSNRKKEKKRALIKTRIYNYYVPYSHAMDLRTHQRKVAS